MDVDCPTVSIKYSAEFATELKFYWTESEGEVDYKFRVNESASPGKWESAGAQTGNNNSENNYEQIIFTLNTEYPTRPDMGKTAVQFEVFSGDEEY